MSVLVPGIADDLRTLREQAGLTRKQLADSAGVSDATVKSIEYGESQSPRPETLRLLANGLATNRLSGRVDREQSDDLYRRLMQATGYDGTAPASPRPMSEIPDDIREQVQELVGTDEGLVRALLADLARRPNENRRAALRFLAEALRLSRESQPNRRRGGR